MVGAVIRARHHPIWGPWMPPRTPDGATRSGGVESSLFFFKPKRHVPIAHVNCSFFLFLHHLFLR